MTDTTDMPRRAAGRGGRKRATRGAVPDAGPALTHIRRPYAPVDVMTAEQEAHVHAMSLRLLAEVGLRFLSPETWPILEREGCKVDRDTGQVLFPPEVVEALLAKAPARFSLHARNPANDLVIGDDSVHFGSASSAPNVIDMDRGRRPGTNADFEDLVRLHQALPACAFHSGHAVEPIDMPANTRHLTSALSWHTLSDKVVRAYAIGETRIEDSLDMVALARGVSRDDLRKTPCAHASINVNSPLVVDAPLIEGAMVLARNGQVNVISPVAFSGAMSPITLSGSIIQCNAEAIGVIAFLQMVAPGAPCLYGVLSTPIDMKSGAPAMGVPETVTGTLAAGQMARRYGVPQRLMLGSTSNAPDAQSAWETMFSLWAAMLSGAHMVYHAVGWMEGGLTTGFEKSILDAEMIGMMSALRGGIDFSDTEEAMAAIADVGPGGHFLGSSHTMSRYRDAIHAPMIADWRPYEFWEKDGAPDASQRANAKWKEMLAGFTPPPLPDDRRAAMEDHVARRIREIGDDEI
jgi:trimethylamine--corrinoid protein Co-methyltransferase